MQLKQEPDGTGEGRPKAVLAYEEIRAAIIAMKIAPGTTLVEREICARLGFSRTPLREAILRLAQEGLVNIVPSGGTFVNRISVRDVVEGQIVREALEMRMVRLAARHYDASHAPAFDRLMQRQEDAGRRGDADAAFAIDDAFHRQICATAGFPTIWQTIHAATGQLDRLRRSAFPRQGHCEEVLAEHRDIQAALAANDETAAAGLMQAHLDSIVSVLRYVMQSSPAIVSGEEDFAMLDMFTRR